MRRYCFPRRAWISLVLRVILPERPGYLNARVWRGAEAATTGEPAWLAATVILGYASTTPGGPGVASLPRSEVVTRTTSIVAVWKRTTTARRSGPLRATALVEGEGQSQSHLLLED